MTNGYTQSPKIQSKVLENTHEKPHPNNKQPIKRARQQRPITLVSPVLDSLLIFKNNNTKANPIK
jgi:hypothetical protein